MRSDPERGDEIKQSDVFEASSRKAADELRSDAWGKNSLSGKERNRLFLSDQGRQFTDISLVSGADHIGDGRGVVPIDYDRDGWVDLAGVNVNAPRLVLFHNRIGELPGMATDRHVVALRFRGASRTDSVSVGRSNRDGYGAKVTLTLPDGSQLVDEHRCGEGFSAQNSSTMLIGIGKNESINSLRVRWPSGIVQQFGKLPADSLVTLHELEAEPEVVPYRVPRRPPSTLPPDFPDETFVVGNAPANGAKLRLHVLTATWCAACKKQLPHLARLREIFSTDELVITGLPGDAEETEEQLTAHASKHRPVYTLIPRLEASDRKALDDLLKRHLGSLADTLPAFILTDATGSVLRVANGVPTVSELAQQLSDAW